MKKYLSLLAVLSLLSACQGKENPSGGDDNGSGNKEVLATAISLSKNELTLEKGTNEVLTVSYTPSNTTNKTVTWVSSNTGIATVTDGIVVGVAPGSTEIVAKCGNASAKCSVTVVISATGIQLNQTEVVMNKGASITLTATLTPADATDVIEWSSSNEAVATVNSGVVTAVEYGEATIIAKAGTKSAECDVKVTDNATSAPKAIDLGLSVKWANVNLGADLEEAYGDFFAWGEAENKEIFSWGTYKWCEGDYHKLTKYNYSSSYGTVDNKTVLEAIDDVAHVKLGGKWRMPTISEVDELFSTWNNASYQWEWKSLNGNKGWLITYLVNNNTIFLPASGYRFNVDRDKVDICGFYWSSSLSTAHPYEAIGMGFDSHQVYRIDGDHRYYGQSIRPVTE